MNDQTAASSLSGEPHIARPDSSRIERAAFFIVRKWPWLFIAGAFLVLAAVLIILVLAIKIGRENIGLTPLHLSTLIALPALSLGVGIMPWQHNRPAPAWLIRTALSTATDEERAAVFARLQHRARSQFETEPLDIQGLVRLFDSAREEYGQRTIRKRKRKVCAKARQDNMLRRITIEK